MQIGKEESQGEASWFKKLTSSAQRLMSFKMQGGQTNKNGGFDPGQKVFKARNKFQKHRYYVPDSAGEESPSDQRTNQGY